MVIKKAQFITSLDVFRDYPGIGRPEIAMVGKSNVGKSSMINRLTNSGKLARTSAEPGKTRLINLFSLNDEIVLVDLPGYGFARVSRGEKQRWAGMIEGYLAQSKNLKRVLMLVDMRHQPTNDDIDMVNYLRHYDIPFTVAATKADKLSRAEKSRSIPVICRTLAVQPWEVIPFSSEDGTGREKLLELLDTLLPAPETETPPQGCE